MTPITPAISTATSPIIKETRPPYNILENISLPKSSVPKKYCPPGGKNLCSKFITSTGCGAIQGASKEIDTKNNKIKAPLTALLLVIILFPTTDQ